MSGLLKGAEPFSTDEIQRARESEEVTRKTLKRGETRFHRFGSLVCPQCMYLEFPGCRNHNCLLSVQKGNDHASCYGCTQSGSAMVCSTDQSSPWCFACRSCESSAATCVFLTMHEDFADNLLVASMRENSESDSILGDWVIRTAILKCNTCDVSVLPIVHGRLARYLNGNIISVADEPEENKLTSDMQNVAVGVIAPFLGKTYKLDDFILQHTNDDCCGSFVEIPVVLPRGEALYVVNSLEDTPRLRTEMSKAVAFKRTTEWKVPKSAIVQTQVEYVKRPKLQFNGPLWLHRSFLGQFGDAYIRDTALEGGSTASSLLFLKHFWTQILDSDQLLPLWTPEDKRTLEKCLGMFSSALEMHQKVSYVQSMPNLSKRDVLKSTVYSYLSKKTDKNVFGLPEDEVDSDWEVEDLTASLLRNEDNKDIPTELQNALNMYHQVESSPHQAWLREKDVSTATASSTNKTTSEKERALHSVALEHAEAILSMQIGETRLLVGGYLRAFTGHVVMHVVTRTSDKQFDLVTCNSGNGVTFHPSAQKDDQEKTKLSLSLCGIALDRLASPVFWLLYLRSQVYASDAHQMNLLYEVLQPFLSNGSLLESENKEDKHSIYRTPQRSGICFYRAVTECMRYILSFNGVTHPKYKVFALDIRYHILSECLQDQCTMKQLQTDGEIGLLRIATKSLARTTLSHIKNGYITLPYADKMLQLIVRIEQQLQSMLPPQSNEWKKTKVQHSPHIAQAEYQALVQVLKSSTTMTTLNCFEEQHVSNNVENEQTVDNTVANTVDITSFDGLSGIYLLGDLDHEKLYQAYAGEESMEKVVMPHNKRFPETPRINLSDLETSHKELIAHIEVLCEQTKISLAERTKASAGRALFALLRALSMLPLPLTLRERGMQVQLDEAQNALTIDKTSLSSPTEGVSSGGDLMAAVTSSIDAFINNSLLGDDEEQDFGFDLNELRQDEPVQTATETVRRVFCVWQDVKMTRHDQRKAMATLQRIQTLLFVTAQSIKQSETTYSLVQIAANALLAITDAVMRVFAVENPNPLSVALEGGYIPTSKSLSGPIFAVSTLNGDGISLDAQIGCQLLEIPQFALTAQKTAEYLKEREARASQVLFRPDTGSTMCSLLLHYKSAELELVRALAGIAGLKFSKSSSLENGELREATQLEIIGSWFASCNDFDSLGHSKNISPLVQEFPEFGCFRDTAFIAMYLRRDYAEIRETSAVLSEKQGALKLLCLSTGVGKTKLSILIRSLNGDVLLLRTTEAIQPHMRPHSATVAAYLENDSVVTKHVLSSSVKWDCKNDSPVVHVFSEEMDSDGNTTTGVDDKSKFLVPSQLTGPYIDEHGNIPAGSLWCFPAVDACVDFPVDVSLSTLLSTNTLHTFSNLLSHDSAEHLMYTLLQPRGVMVPMVLQLFWEHMDAGWLRNNELRSLLTWVLLARGRYISRHASHMLQRTAPSSSWLQGTSHHALLQILASNPQCMNMFVEIVSATLLDIVEDAEQTKEKTPLVLFMPALEILYQSVSVLQFINFALGYCHKPESTLYCKVADTMDIALPYSYSSMFADYGITRSAQSDLHDNLSQTLQTRGISCLNACLDVVAATMDPVEQGLFNKTLHTLTAAVLSSCKNYSPAFVRAMISATTWEVARVKHSETDADPLHVDPYLWQTLLDRVDLSLRFYTADFDLFTVLDNVSDEQAFLSACTESILNAGEWTREKDRLVHSSNASLDRFTLRLATTRGSYTVLPEEFLEFTYLEDVLEHPASSVGSPPIVTDNAKTVSVFDSDTRLQLWEPRGTEWIHGLPLPIEQEEPSLDYLNSEQPVTEAGVRWLGQTFTRLYGSVDLPEEEHWVFSTFEEVLDECYGAQKELLHYHFFLQDAVCTQQAVLVGFDQSHCVWRVIVLDKASQTVSGYVLVIFGRVAVPQLLFASDKHFALATNLPFQYTVDDTDEGIIRVARWSRSSIHSSGIFHSGPMNGSSLLAYTRHNGMEKLLLPRHLFVGILPECLLDTHTFGICPHSTIVHAEPRKDTEDWLQADLQLTLQRQGEGMQYAVGHLEWKEKNGQIFHVVNPLKILPNTAEHALLAVLRPFETPAYTLLLKLPSSSVVERILFPRLKRSFTRNKNKYYLDQNPEWFLSMDVPMSNVTTQSLPHGLLQQHEYSQQFSIICCNAPLKPLDAREEPFGTNVEVCQDDAEWMKVTKNASKTYIYVLQHNNQVWVDATQGFGASVYLFTAYTLNHAYIEAGQLTRTFAVWDQKLTDQDKLLLKKVENTLALKHPDAIACRLLLFNALKVNEEEIEWMHENIAHNKGSNAGEEFSLLDAYQDYVARLGHVTDCLRLTSEQERWILNQVEYLKNHGTMVRHFICENDAFRKNYRDQFAGVCDLSRGGCVLANDQINAMGAKYAQLKQCLPEHYHTALWHDAHFLDRKALLPSLHSMEQQAAHLSATEQEILKNALPSSKIRTDGECRTVDNFSSEGVFQPHMDLVQALGRYNLLYGDDIQSWGQSFVYKRPKRAHTRGARTMWLLNKMLNDDIDGTSQCLGQIFLLELLNGDIILEPHYPVEMLKDKWLEQKKAGISTPITIPYSSKVKYHAFLQYEDLDSELLNVVPYRNPLRMDTHYCSILLSQWLFMHSTNMNQTTYMYINLFGYFMFASMYIVLQHSTRILNALSKGEEIDYAEMLELTMLKFSIPEEVRPIHHTKEYRKGSAVPAKDSAAQKLIAYVYSIMQLAAMKKETILSKSMMQVRALYKSNLVTEPIFISPGETKPVPSEQVVGRMLFYSDLQDYIKLPDLISLATAPLHSLSSQMCVDIPMFEETETTLVLLPSELTKNKSDSSEWSEKLKELETLKNNKENVPILSVYQDVIRAVLSKHAEDLTPYVYTTLSRNANYQSMADSEAKEVSSVVQTSVIALQSWIKKFQNMQQDDIKSLQQLSTEITKKQLHVSIEDVETVLSWPSKCLEATITSKTQGGIAKKQNIATQGKLRPAFIAHSDRNHTGTLLLAHMEASKHTELHDELRAWNNTFETRWTSLAAKPRKSSVPSVSWSGFRGCNYRYMLEKMHSVVYSKPRETLSFISPVVIPAFRSLRCRISRLNNRCMGCLCIVSNLSNEMMLPARYLTFAKELRTKYGNVLEGAYAEYQVCESLREQLSSQIAKKLYMMNACIYHAKRQLIRSSVLVNMWRTCYKGLEERVERYHTALTWTALGQQDQQARRCEVLRRYCGQRTVGGIAALLQLLPYVGTFKNERTLVSLVNENLTGVDVDKLFALVAVHSLVQNRTNLIQKVMLQLSEFVVELQSLPERLHDATEDKSTLLLELQNSANALSMALNTKCHHVFIHGISSTTASALEEVVLTYDPRILVFEQSQCIYLRKAQVEMLHMTLLGEMALPLIVPSLAVVADLVCTPLHVQSVLTHPNNTFHDQPLLRRLTQLHPLSPNNIQLNFIAEANFKARFPVQNNTMTVIRTRMNIAINAATHRRLAKKNQLLITSVPLLDQKYSSQVRQLIMGGGKTTVITPILTHCAHTPNTFSVYVAPDALFQMAVVVCRNNITSYIHRPVYTLEFSRDLGGFQGSGIARNQVQHYARIETRRLQSVLDAGIGLLAGLADVPELTHDDIGDILMTNRPVKTIMEKLEACALAQGVLVATDTTIKTLYLKSLECMQLSQTYLDECLNFSVSPNTTVRDQVSMENLRSGSIATMKEDLRLLIHYFPKTFGVAVTLLYTAYELIDCVRRISEANAILDEVDFVLHPLKSELNFPIGVKTPCTPAIRGDLAVLLLSAVHHCVNPDTHQSTLLSSVKAIKCGQTAVTQLYDVVQEGITNKSITTQPFFLIVDSTYYNEQFKQCIGLLCIAWLQTHNISIDQATLYSSPSDQELVRLCQQWAQVYLPHCLTQLLDVEYGLYSESICAVPYSGLHTPQKHSEFAQIDILAGLTTQAYLYKGLRLSDTSRLVQWLKNNLAHEVGIAQNRPTAKLFQSWVPGDLPLSRVQVNNPGHLLLIHETWRYNTQVIEYYVTRLVLTETMKKQITGLSVNGFDLASGVMLENVIGFSGTPTSLLPLSLGSCHFELGTDAKTYTTLSHESTASVLYIEEVSRESNGKNKLTNLEYAILENIAQNKCHCLIDIGACIVGCTNEEFASLILQEAHRFQGVVYINDNNEPFVKLRHAIAGQTDIPLEACGLPLSERFVYFDQTHCYGTNIKQVPTAHGYVTINKDTTFRDLSQACYRLRNLGEGQTIAFLLSSSIVKLLKKECELESPASVLKPQHISAWAVSNANMQRKLQNHQAKLQQRQEIPRYVQSRNNKTKQSITKTHPLFSVFHNPSSHCSLFVTQMDTSILPQTQAYQEQVQKETQRVLDDYGDAQARSKHMIAMKTLGVDDVDDAEQTLLHRLEQETITIREMEVEMEVEMQTLEKRSYLEYSIDKEMLEWDIYTELVQGDTNRLRCINSLCFGHTPQLVGFDNLLVSPGYFAPPLGGLDALKKDAALFRLPETMWMLRVQNTSTKVHTVTAVVDEYYTKLIDCDISSICETLFNQQNIRTVQDLAHAAGSQDASTYVLVSPEEALCVQNYLQNTRLPQTVHIDILLLSPSKSAQVIFSTHVVERTSQVLPLYIQGFLALFDGASHLAQSALFPLVTNLSVMPVQDRIMFYNAMYASKHKLTQHKPNNYMFLALHAKSVFHLVFLLHLFLTPLQTQTVAETYFRDAGIYLTKLHLQYILSPIYTDISADDLRILLSILDINEDQQISKSMVETFVQTH